MSKKLVSGVYAAAITPRDSDGKLDERALRKELDFLIGRGIRGFAINGATGEYCLTTADELSAAVAAAAEVTEGRAEFVCGIGSAGVRGCIENGIIAIKGGAKGLLLPTPHFFPYEQDDVEAFCHEVADQLPAPILLYNLPQFTTGFQPDTVVKLISENPTIVGIKDSSGSLDILRTLTGQGIESCRVVGNDGVLAAALTENVCDAGISGVAAVLPELLLTIFDLRSKPLSEEFLSAARTLDEFIQAVAGIPVPWALKWIGESREIAAATFAQPVADRRKAQARALQEWFRAWHKMAPAVV